MAAVHRARGHRVSTNGYFAGEHHRITVMKREASDSSATVPCGADVNYLVIKIGQDGEKQDTVTTGHFE